MEFQTKHTRFRAYQLKSKGSSFSYWDGSNFTLCEARYNDDNKNSIWHELKVCGKTSIDLLHITSWDADHCSSTELINLLKELKPKRIEYPGYPIDTNTPNQVASLAAITNYEASELTTPKIIRVNKIDGDYVSKLNNATEWGYSNILFNNKKDYPASNNNSTIKLFKTGCFSVLSLGDLELEEISKWLVQFKMIKTEVDILIMAHHGSDNGFTTADFLDAVKPKVAFCLCDFDNQYDHPSKNVLQLLLNRKIDYYSTKQGDVIIESIEDHQKKYKVWDYISNGGKLRESPETYRTKRSSKAFLDALNKIINK